MKKSPVEIQVKILELVLIEDRPILVGRVVIGSEGSKLSAVSRLSVAVYCDTFVIYYSKNRFHVDATYLDQFLSLRTLPPSEGFP